ncbi:MAG TPA: hypothetical protein VGD84_03250, partial [Pseudonocardiaceae bacterium]
PRSPLDAAPPCREVMMSTELVAFHDLSFVPEGEEVVVGRSDTGTYVVLPVDGAALLTRMVEGMPPNSAADWYEDTYGEPVDVVEFLDTLAELGFLRNNATEVLAAPVGRPWVTRLAAAVFSPVAWVVYAAIFVAWLVAVTRHPDLLPRPGQVFFTGSLVLVQLVIIVCQWPLIFLHEGSHVLAGRRLGLPSTLGVSNRLISIVFETRMNSVLSVPRRQRYLPFLSGMACDLVVWCLLGLIAELTRAPDGTFSVAGRVALALALTCVLRLAWQFQLYLRTDLYYVVSTAWNCHNLHDASMTMVRNRIWRLLGRPDRIVDEEQWTVRDRRVGRWYGPCMAFGICVFLAIAALGSIPVLVRYVEIVASRLHTGMLDAGFWDVVVSLLINVANIVALVVLARRKRRRSAAPGVSRGEELA